MRRVSALIRFVTTVTFGLVGVMGLVAGCATSTDDSAGSEDDIRRRSHRYVDVSAEEPMTGIPRDKILGALNVLDRVGRTSTNPLRRAIAAETLARIEAGDVLLGSIGASRGIDRWHMCKDEKERACAAGPPPPPDDRTWRGDAALARRLERDLDGYMWGNRIYFTLSARTDVEELASTLVHETNHAANRSECHYYRDIENHVVDPDPAWVEEFRAFLSECLFEKDSADGASCSDYAAERVADYGFAARLSRILPDRSNDPKRLGELIVAAEPSGPAPFGRPVPHREHWPASFGACASR